MPGGTDQTLLTFEPGPAQRSSGLFSRVSIKADVFAGGV